MTKVARLINTFTPEHYTLQLTLLREERRFFGSVELSGEATKPTRHLFLHSKDLEITQASVDGQEVTTNLGDNDELQLASEGQFAAGRHTILLHFKGVITDAMHGLYPCYYTVEGKKQELLATQFESHHAREVFPCLDEPEAKATFDLTLTTEASVTVLGNMPMKQQERANGQLVTSFQTTPRMSTYLLAFVTGDLQEARGTTKGGVDVGIWATKAQPADSLEFALTTSIRAIEFFDDYFGTPYPLPKADHVALPDFSSGAMENWGLITYREACLLADPKTTSVSSREYIATVIVHELSHQWFGNLVTMRWWDDLWLNESFASLMEYIALDALHPEWQPWMNFTTSEALPSLRRDSLPGVQAVKTDVAHPDEISALFDPAIVYAKGARILRMLQVYIGSEAFRTGLKQYFADHAYKNTEGADLWRAFAKAAGKDIEAFMRPWLEVSGFPVVAATLNGDELRLQQRQFLIGAEPDNRLWPIPLNASQANLPELMEDVALTATVSEGIVKLNQGDAAHFITHYDATLQTRLLTAIANQELPAVDRLQVLHEASLLPRAGISSTASLIPLLSAYKDENAEQVWDIIAVVSGELRRFVETDSTAEAALKQLSRQLAETQYQRLGWTPQPDEPKSDTKLRATIIAMMLYAEEPSAIKAGLEAYEKAIHIADLDSELASLILTAAVRHHEQRDTVVSRLLTEYGATASSDIQQDISSALTASKDPRTLERLLEVIKDKAVVRPQDVPRWFAYLIRNRYSRELTWQWLQDNWSWVEEQFQSDKSYDVFPRYAAMALQTADQLESYKAFFTPLLDQPGLTRSIEVGISEIEGRVDWFERDQAGVIAALEAL